MRRLLLRIDNSMDLDKSIINCPTPPTLHHKKPLHTKILDEWKEKQQTNLAKEIAGGTRPLHLPKVIQRHPEEGGRQKRPQHPWRISPKA